MALPTIGTRKSCVVSVEFNPTGAVGVYTKWCGAKNFSLNLVNEFTEEKVGDCDDWSLPIQTLVAPSGQKITASMDATWTPATHIQTSDWALNQKRLRVKVEFPAATTGQVQDYIGYAYLDGLELGNIGNTEGAAITESVSLTYDGTVTRTLKA